MSLFKVNRANLIHARAVVRQHGKCYLHADGNVFVNPEDSSFRKDFTNPNPDGTPAASSYVLEIKNLDQVPTSVKQAEEAFLRAKNQEQRDNANKPKSGPLVRTFAANEDDENAIEADENEEVFQPANQIQLAKAVVVKAPPPPPPPPVAKETQPAPKGKGQTALSVTGTVKKDNVNKGQQPPAKKNQQAPPPPPPPPAEGSGVVTLKKDEDVSKGAGGVEI